MNEREKARQQAEVMLHFANGGEVEQSVDGVTDWVALKECNPLWNWERHEYRKKPRKFVVEFDPNDGRFLYMHHSGTWFEKHNLASITNNNEIYIRIPPEVLDKIAKGET